MGEAKRKTASGGQSTARIEICDPRDRTHTAGTIMLHVLHEKGASVSGASWKRIFTPSIVCSSTGWTMSWVGAISPGVPRAAPLPNPAST